VQKTKERKEGEEESEPEEETETASRKTMNMSLKSQNFYPQERTFVMINPNRVQESKRLHHLTVSGLGLPIPTRTLTGLPAVDAAALKVLAGEPSSGKWGTAYTHYLSLGKEEQGKNCCIALESLLKYKSIETLINNFISPLQNLADAGSRIHYSLNLNTETGRLSAKRPNAQNQPALDK
jgi:DNA polymerase-1